jgi:replicative DNA helicase
LSRSVESRSNKEPILSDLRDSWSLEQDADLVMMLYRSSYYDQEDKKERLEVFIRKNRNWSTWTVSFKLLLHIMKIYWIWK